MLRILETTKWQKNAGEITLENVVLLSKGQITGENVKTLKCMN